MRKIVEGTLLGLVGLAIAAGAAGAAYFMVFLSGGG